LPRVFGVQADFVPSKEPYLFADEKLEDEWRVLLGERAGPRIAVAWSEPLAPENERISLAKGDFACLTDVKGVQLVALPGNAIAVQTGVDQHTILSFSERLPNRVLVDAAALLMNVDLAIVPDGAFAHLAGALGVPVWVLVSSEADWRWGQKSSKSPWYPTATWNRSSRPRTGNGPCPLIPMPLRHLMRAVLLWLTQVS
jgi:hypothetical protein